jgi:hypothetical protein
VVGAGPFGGFKDGVADVIAEFLVELELTSQRKSCERFDRRGVDDAAKKEQKDSATGLVLHKSVIPFRLRQPSDGIFQ